MQLKNVKPAMPSGYFMVTPTSPKPYRSANTRADCRACQVTPACQSIYEGTQSARTMPSLRIALLY
jgi:hypothetical protein